MNQLLSPNNQMKPAGTSLDNRTQKTAIAYILMEYPRVSESFIINEIYQLEQMGVALQLFSIKKPTEKKVQGNVGKITAPVTYLPSVTSLSSTHFLKWLQVNIPQYVSSHRRLFQLRPGAYLRTLGEALGMSLRYRPTALSRPKKVFIKEFLQAGYMARALLEAGHIGRLHAHFCHGSSTIAMFASRLTGIPFSFTAHAKDIYVKTLNPGDLLKRKISRASFIVTCTDANRKYLESICRDGAAIHTVYHGLAPDVFTPSQHKEDDIPLILSVGRFVEKKGFPHLVQACRFLRDRGHVFHCQIIGDPGDEVSGNQKPMVQQLITDLQLQDTVFLAPGVTQEALKEIYRQAAIFALPCQVLANGDRDGIPNVVAEAMATGLPVVSTTISGIPELISHGVNGLLVPEKDPYALAQSLEELLTNPAFRRRLGQEARRTILRMFDSRHTTVALKNLFHPPLTMEPLHVATPSHEPVGIQ